MPYNVTISLNVSYAKKEKIYPAYISKYNSNHEKQVILLMIWNGEKQWHYLAIKKPSALLRGITCKHYSDFLLSELPSFFRNRKKKLNYMEKYVKIKFFATS